MGAIGVRAKVGLPLSALAVMLGIVLALNSDRYGIAGIAAGLLLAVAGVAAAAICFRRPRGTPVVRPEGGADDGSLGEVPAGGSEDTT